MASNVTDVSICSNALGLLGEDPITALSDDSERARLANRWYEITRDALIQDHPWNFALERVELAKLVTTPSFEYGVAFQLPSDHLRIVKVESGEAYKVEGDILLSDEGSEKILYIKRLTDPTRFSPLFVMALQAQLAMIFAQALVGKQSLQGQMAQLSQYWLGRARTSDALEGSKDYVEAKDLSEVR